MRVNINKLEDIRKLNGLYRLTTDLNMYLYCDNEHYHFLNAGGRSYYFDKEGNLNLSEVMNSPLYSVDAIIKGGSPLNTYVCGTYEFIMSIEEIRLASL